MALRPVFKAGIGRLRCLIGRCAAAPGSPWSAEKGLSRRFAAYYWECVCPGPFCIGGTTCYWIEFWDGLILPGHWVSIDISGGGHYVKWSLDGGPNTQVSLAARY